MKRRLAFLLPDMSGGGAERVALTLIRDFVERGHEVDLVLTKSTGELLPLVPKQVRIVDLRARRFRNALFPLVHYLRERRPHGLQVSMWPLTVVGIIAAKIARVRTRVVVSEHIVLSGQYGASKAAMFAIRATARFVYPRAAARIAVSSGAADDLSRLSGMPRESIEVVYNPIDPPDAEPVDPDADGVWGGEGHRILNVGRLDPQKNQMLLLEAFARLPAGCDARLMILGEGALRDDLERRASELGIFEKVAMPGFRPDPGPFYRSADLFVLSSNFEGYPLVMIEAMYCGLTIVSTNCPSGPSEILDRGRFGTLTPCGDSQRLADAIAAALSSPANPGRIKARAVELSAHAADRYWELMTG